MTKILQTHWWALLAVLFAALAFSPVLDAGWVAWDDDQYITENSAFQTAASSDIAALWSTEHPSWVPDTFVPLTVFSFALDFRSAELDAGRYHLVNLLLHLLNVLLAYWLSFLLLRNAKGAFLVAILFGLHPAHVEAVAWISARKDVLYALFFLGISVSWLRYLKAEHKAIPYTVSLLLFALACLAKPQAIVLPAILLLFDYWTERKHSSKLWLDKLPFAAVALAFVAFAIAVKIPDGAEYSFDDRFWYSSYAMLRYVGMLFIPVGMAAAHPFPGGDVATSDPMVYVGAVLCVALIAAAVWAFRKNRPVFFGIAFALIALAPTLHFVKINSSPFYERFTYIAYLGAFIALAHGWLQLAKTRQLPAVALPAVAIVLGLGFGWLSYQQSQTWQSNETLWTNVIEQHPDFYMGYTKRGTHYNTHNEPVLAAADFGRALELKPTDVYAWNNRGLIFLRSKDYDQAIQHFDMVLQLDPTFGKAWMNRGLANMNLGNFDAAKSDMESALNYLANEPVAHINHGFLFQQMEDYEQAFRCFDRAAKLDPNFGPAYFYRGKEYFYHEGYTSALKDFTNVINLDLKNGEARYWRARTYFKMQRYQDAMADVEGAQNLGYTVEPEFVEALKKLVK